MTRSRFRGPASTPPVLRGSALAAFAVVLLALSFVSPAAAGPPGTLPAPAAGAPPPPGHFPIYAHETGLLTNTRWTISVQGHPYNSTHSTILVNETPGFYSVEIPPAGLYQPNQSFVPVNVGPVPSYVNVTFVKNTSIFNQTNQSDTTTDTNNTSHGLFGLPPLEGDVLIAVIGLGVVALASVFLILRKGRRSRAPAKAKSEDEDSADDDDKTAQRSKPRPTKDERRRAQRRREKREAAKTKGDDAEE